MLFDINNFGPFRSDVWGSVSDWFYVIIAAITAYYLVKTFRAQSKTLELQTKLNHDEYLKHKLSIRPHFKLDFINKETLSENWYKTNFNLEFIFSITNNQRLENLKPLFLSDNLNWENSKYIGKPIPSFEPYHKLNYTAKYKNTKRKAFSIEDGFFVKLCFDDVLGNSYEQDFRFLIRDHKPTFIEYQPTEVKKQNNYNPPR